MVSSLPLWTAGSALAAPSGTADDPVAKPPWLEELSFEISASYDDNIFFQGLGDLAGRTSPILSIKPRVTFALLRPSDETPRRHLALIYEPELVRYLTWSDQNHENHRIQLLYSRETAKTKWSLENDLVLTDGRGTAQEWSSPLGLPRSPVIGGPEFRSRTANHEIKGRATVTLQLGPDWFIRPLAQWWASDFRTQQRVNVIPNPANTFYGNYVDRADFHAGLDIGRRVSSRTHVTLGYRAGMQDQGSLAGSPYQYDNHYQVVLFGLEGAPSPRLKYGFQAGPDFRSYGPTIRPGEDPHRVAPYAAGKVWWALGARTQLNGSLKLFRFMPGGGAGAMEMRLGRVELERRVASDLRFRAGFRVYGGALDKPDPRGADWLLTGFAGVSWTRSDSLVLDLSYSFDAGRSEEEDIYQTPEGPIPGPNGSGREYERNVLTVSVRVSL